METLGKNKTPPSIFLTIFFPFYSHSPSSLSFLYSPLLLFLLSLSVSVMAPVGHLGRFLLILINSLLPWLNKFFFWTKYSESAQIRHFLILDNSSIMFSYRHRECLHLYPLLLYLPTQRSEMGLLSCKSGLKCQPSRGFSVNKFLHL